MTQRAPKQNETKMILKNRIATKAMPKWCNNYAKMIQKDSKSFSKIQENATRLRQI